MPAQIIARALRAAGIVMMPTNAAEGEKRERVLETLAGSLTAVLDELREGLASFREKRSAWFGQGGASLPKGNQG